MRGQTSVDAPYFVCYFAALLRHTMKSKFLPLLFCLLPFAFCPAASAQGTAFTYQGRLNASNAPANGSYDLQITAWDTVTNGSPVSATSTLTGVAVTSGLFTVTLDLGGAFTGAARWLELAVRTNGGGSYTTLTPRQAVTPTPYAIFAANTSNLVGTVASANLAGNYSNAVNLNNATNTFNGTFSGNGANVTNVNAATLGGLTSSNYWQLGGNHVGTNQFLGSTNNQPLEFKANGARALRLEPNTNGAPNVIGGSSLNFVSNGVIGATIGGGGVIDLLSFPYSNSVTMNFGTIGGGLQNTVNGSQGTVGGGFANTASGLRATVSGGYTNTASGITATVGGGYSNQATNNFATVPGGNSNLAGGQYSFAAGNQAKATNTGAFVWADSIASDFGSSKSNEFAVRATGGLRIIVSNAPATIDGIPILLGSGASALAWQLVSGTTFQAQPRYGYLLTNTSSVSVALPTNASLGDITRVSGGGSGGWRITQAANQSIRTANLNTVLGTNGAWTATSVSTNNWLTIAASADGNRLLAARSGAQIIYSSDGGVTWTTSSSISAAWASVALSADGTKGVACSAGGVIYTTANGGADWTITPAPLTAWAAVCASANGVRLTAVPVLGNIYYSTNSGSTWVNSGFSGEWTSVACSADGARLVAGYNNGNLRGSSDYGVTWTLLNSSPVLIWQAVAASANGGTFTAGSATTAIYVSRDSGTTWLASGSPPLNCKGLAMSSDGAKILASANGVPLMTTTDTGVTWKTNNSAALTWRGVASSADGGRLAATVNGGSIYTLQPGASQTTTIGANGYLIGGPGTAIELQYVATNLFQPISHEGSIYAY